MSVVRQVQLHGSIIFYRRRCNDGATLGPYGFFARRGVELSVGLVGATTPRNTSSLAIAPPDYTVLPHSGSQKCFYSGCGCLLCRLRHCRHLNPNRQCVATFRRCMITELFRIPF